MPTGAALGAATGLGLPLAAGAGVDGMLAGVLGVPEPAGALGVPVASGFSVPIGP
jgi:hypothetical protein